jgi:hypothetical protein
MTSLKDPVRQASLFTPWGLIDPRLMPEHYENTRQEMHSKGNTASTSFWTSVKNWLENVIPKVSRKNPAHS